MFDVIVVGGGPAGMTAGLYAERNGKHALVIEKAGFGGQITHSPKVENYPGTLSMSGNEFAEKMLDQIMAQGAEIEFENVVSVEKKDNAWLVKTEEGSEYEGKTVVLATGVKHRMLGIEGEEELVGEGISFCAVCDGDFYAGRTVCVAGGGNSALQEAILLAGKCKEVIILQDLPFITAEGKLQDVINGCDNVRVLTNVKITGFETGDEGMTGVQITQDGNADTVKCDGLFVAIGLIPENDAFKDLVDLNSYGYFDADETCVTKTNGIFVAGDCRAKGVRQLTTAVADGATSALAAVRYINENSKLWE
ncbi:MAG: FAD-dependent oxidoreductase [Solobacterium sp.]|nr:FAD-dependent oxidoreductase [Solobacterium sp.]